MKGVPINFLQYDSEEEFIQTGYLLFHTVGLIMDVAEKYHVPTDTVIDVITESIIAEEKQRKASYDKKEM